ncbi:MAG: hypothetical protein ABI434_08090 [Burkholderiaceae bacterium]
MKKQTNYFGWQFWQRCGIALAAFCMLLVTAHAAGVAMVTDLQGKATIIDASKSFDASIYADIEAGTQIQLQGNAKLSVLYLEGGNEYSFRGPAEIAFKASQPEMISGAQPEKRSPSLSPGVRIKAIGMNQGAIVLRGSAGGTRIKLQSASGTRVMATQPEFRWQEPQPGLKYHVEIADDTGRSLYDAQVEANSFTLPPALQLKDGQSYTWEVSARLPDGRKYSSVGVFSVATDELRTQALALRVDDSASVSSRVIYAAWLDQVELKDEARKYWRALLAERPEDARLKALAER